MAIETPQRAAQMESSTYYVVGILLAVLAGIWKVFQTQLDALAKRLEKLEDVIVGRKEYEEFARRVDHTTVTILSQIRTLEATRPTTGELQAIGDANKEQITKLEDRVGNLERGSRIQNG